MFVTVGLCSCTLKGTTFKIEKEEMDFALENKDKNILIFRKLFDMHRIHQYIKQSVF